MQQNCRLEGDKGAIAFSGELGPTVAELTHRRGWGYERASDLLGCIIAERGAKDNA
jgi:hypothetical protein